MAEELARLVAVVEANLKGFTKDMATMQRIADQRFGALEKRMKKSESAFASFGRSIRGALLGGLSLVGVQRFVSSISDIAGKLQDTSDALGVGTGSLQTWGVLAARAGIGQDQFNKSLGAFAARLGEAQLKGGSFAKFLTGIGVGTQGSTEEVFFRLADAIKNTANQQQRAAIVAEAFGAKAVKLTPVLQQGAAALKAQGVELEKLGLIMGSDTIQKIEKLGDQWEDLKRKFQVTGANALAPLLDEISSPAFLKGVEQFAKGMSEVAVALARMAPHLPALGGLLLGLRVGGPIGGAIGGTVGLALEAWRRQLGLVQDSIAKLEKDLANAQARAARREPGAAAQAAGIQAQINRQRAQAAGIPFAGPGAPVKEAGGIDRSGSISTESTSGKTVAEREAELDIETQNKVARAIADIREQRFEDDEKFRADQFEAAKERRDAVTEMELAGLEDFHERANAAWDDYYQRQAEQAMTAYDMRLQAADQFFGILAQLTTSSSEELASIGKAAAIIQATIDGILGVQKALASLPYPYNLIAAASVAVVAGANVAKIAGMEHGGRVQAGTPYVVGEKRAELFVPDQSGRIIPSIPQAMASNAIGQSGHTFNIDARGAAPGVERLIRAAVVEAVALADRNNRRTFARNMARASDREL